MTFNIDNVSMFVPFFLLSAPPTSAPPSSVPAASTSSTSTACNLSACSPTYLVLQVRPVARAHCAFTSSFVIYMGRISHCPRGHERAAYKRAVPKHATSQRSMHEHHRQLVSVSSHLLGASS